jgi:hypothetical protein
MNIFFLDRNPKLAAIYHNDKHVVETVHRVLDGEMYKED